MMRIMCSPTSLERGSDERPRRLYHCGRPSPTLAAIRAIPQGIRVSTTTHGWVERKGGSRVAETFVGQDRA